MVGLEALAFSVPQYYINLTDLAVAQGSILASTQSGWASVRWPSPLLAKTPLLWLPARGGDSCPTSTSIRDPSPYLSSAPKPELIIVNRSPAIFMSCSAYPPYADSGRCRDALPAKKLSSSRRTSRDMAHVWPVNQRKELEPSRC
jgi:hypothetical protein